MNFKEYCKENKKFAIGIMLGIIFFYFIIVYDYKSYADGSLIGNICIFSFMTILCIMAFFGDFYKTRRDCIYCQQKYENEKALYKNFTYDNLIDLIYEDDVLNLELIGCPDGLTTEQEKEFVKEYISKLKEN